MPSSTQTASAEPARPCAHPRSSWSSLRDRLPHLGTTWLGIKLAVDNAASAGCGPALRHRVSALVPDRACTTPVRCFPKGKAGLFALIVVLYFRTAVPADQRFGEQYVSSGLAALLFSTMPVFTVIFSGGDPARTDLGDPARRNRRGFFSLGMILHEQGVGFAYRSVFRGRCHPLAALLHAYCYVTTKKRGASD